MSKKKRVTGDDKRRIAKLARSNEDFHELAQPPLPLHLRSRAIKPSHHGSAAPLGEPGMSGWPPMVSRGESVATPVVSRGERLMKAYLDEILPSLTPLDNIRPEWLLNRRTGKRLELDRYYPEIQAAFEFQGDQHFRSVELFEGSVKYQVSLDELKARLCRGEGINLVRVVASELKYTRMKYKLEYALKGHRRDLSRKRRGKIRRRSGTMKRLRALDKQAIQYRRQLEERYPETVTTSRGANKLRRMTLREFYRRRRGLRHGEWPRRPGRW